jgi:CrcB protein
MSAISPFMATLHVAVGGAIGSVLRYQSGRWMTHWLGPQMVTAFPWATLAVNAAGSLAMGLLAGWLARHGSPGQLLGGDQMRLLLGVGLLGGFTTFSAFSLEMVMLIERGQYLFAALYLILSVALGISGLMFGLAAMRLIG